MASSVRAFPPEAIAVIDAQDLGLAALAAGLLALRDRPGSPARKPGTMSEAR